MRRAHRRMRSSCVESDLQGLQICATMKNFTLMLAALMLGCSSPADNLAKCPAREGTPSSFTPSDFACSPAAAFAGRASTTLLVEANEFQPYFDLYVLAVKAEPLLGTITVRVPYALDGRMRTRDEAIGKAWTNESFHTSVSAFNDLVSMLKITPYYLETFELQIKDNLQFYTIATSVTEATPMYSNKLVGEAFEAIGVFLQRDEGDAFPGDSIWTWTGDNQAKIDVAAFVGDCFDGDGCGTHYFEVDVSLAGATVRDKGGFVPADGLQLAPGTIHQPN